MNIIQITPGAGGMFCGNCFRDNALVAALRKQGHDATLIPLYLPMRLEEEDQSAGTPIFYSGINVYLQEKSAFYRKAPGWLRDVLASPALLKWAAGKAAKTRAEDVGGLTISMLRGEEGNQARELSDLISWLSGKARPDVICLSNALLVGLARKLRLELNVPVICFLQGEDAFLDALPVQDRDLAWKTLATRAHDVELFIAPSRYFGELMGKRLGLPTSKVHVLANGINLQGYTASAETIDPPVLGYFARMCREKGLDTLVEAFILIHQSGRVPGLRLRVGGGCGPSDEPFVAELRARLERAGLLNMVEFSPNLPREAKQQFLRGLSVFSVPALYGEAFGLYLLEAMASGIPVVQPRTAAFPEILEATGGGLLCEPGNVKSLAETVERVLLDAPLARKLSETGRGAVHANFGIDKMAASLAENFSGLLQARAGSSS